jgi:hypothetical protein
VSEFDSITRIAGDTEADEVWCCVKRTINGSTVRYIERFHARAFDTIDDAYFVDCATTAAGGLSHLEGETVNVLADGVVQPQQTVSSGSVATTAFPTATTQAIGLPITYKLKPMKLNLNDMAFITTKRVIQVILSLYRSVGGKVGRDESHLDNINYELSNYDTGTALFTGTKELPFEGSYDKDGDILIQDDSPLPMTVRAVGVKLEVNND